MATTSAKMGLRIWNLLTDLYDHAQLADNWARVDYHDHSPGKGVQVPTEGLADGAVTGPKLASALDPSGAYLSYKVLVRAGGANAVGAAAGTYVLRTDASACSAVPVPANNSVFYLDPDDWVSTGRTLSYRLRVAIITNAVAPGATYAFSLYPVATWGGASGAVPTVATLGAAVTGSTVTFVAPPASAPTAPQFAEFAPPTAGFYVIATVQTGGAAAGSIPTFISTLSTRQV